MRTLLSILAVLVSCLLVGLPGYADAPKTLNYQGYLTDTAGTPISGSRSITFRLYAVASGGTALWSETLPTVSLTNGIYQVVLGAATPLTLQFDVPYYLGVAVGTDPELTPRQPLTSTPYALGLAPGSVVKLTDTTSTSQALSITSTNGQNALAVTKTGSGSAGSFSITDQANNYGAVYGYTAGTGVGVYGVAMNNGYAGRMYTVGATNSKPSLIVETMGIGSAGAFSVINTESSGNAVYGGTVGTGAAARFEVIEPLSSANAVQATVDGTGAAVSANGGNQGKAGSFTNANSQPALYVASSGSDAALSVVSTGTASTVGSALKALTTGTGAAARIEIDNPSNINPALTVTTDATNVALAASNMGNANGGAVWIVVANSSNTAHALHSAHYGSGRAVYGDAVHGVGVVGESLNNTGVWGIADEGIGVDGSSTSGVGVKGRTGENIAVYGVNNSTSLPAIEGWNQGSGDIFRGWSGASGSQTKKFSVSSSGALWAVSKSFRIDHPLDPKNRYLNHVSVESPDMKNLYDGVLTTDDQGLATVLLPTWFEALNMDFRYQLTVLGDGAWAKARVFREIADNRFIVQTDLPNTRVSWQVTGIRKDAWAEKNRIPVEQEKPVAERGSCIEPAACGK